VKQDLMIDGWQKHCHIKEEPFAVGGQRTGGVA